MLEPNTLNFQKNITDTTHAHTELLLTPWNYKFYNKTKPNQTLLEEDQTILMQTTSPEVVSV